jgi:hypothetical protein
MTPRAERHRRAGGVLGFHLVTASLRAVSSYDPLGGAERPEAMLRAAFTVLYLIGACSGSIQFEAKLVNKFRPARCFGVDDGCKLLRRVADHVASEFIEPFAQHGQG